jgi:hypothetical protein
MWFQGVFKGFDFCLCLTCVVVLNVGVVPSDCEGRFLIPTVHFQLLFTLFEHRIIATFQFKNQNPIDNMLGVAPHMHRTYGPLHSYLVKHIYLIKLGA